MQCHNSECRLRFPLDLAAFEGHYCPRCGSPLTIVSKAVPVSSDGRIPGHTNPDWVGVLDNIRSIHNVGSIFRAADGAGFSHLYCCGITPTPEDNQQLSKTALGAEKSVGWSYHANAVDLAHTLKSQGIMLIALERVPDALSIESFRVPDVRRCALIVGSEPAGMDPGLLELADLTISLPMLGYKGSLNVAVSFSIAAYWLRLSH